MRKEFLENLESLLVHANMLRDEEYAFSWQRSPAECNLYVWPATGNHTVWKDIASLAQAIDSHPYPDNVELVDGTTQLVYIIDTY